MPGVHPCPPPVRGPLRSGRTPRSGAPRARSRAPARQSRTPSSAATRAPPWTRLASGTRRARLPDFPGSHGPRPRAARPGVPKEHATTSLLELYFAPPVHSGAPGPLMERWMGTNRPPATQGHGVSSVPKGPSAIQLPVNHLQSLEPHIPFRLTPQIQPDIPTPVPAYISLPALYPRIPSPSNNG
jgi:hypothetical protein